MTDADFLLALINRRERQLLVHSYIYYELNDNIIEDSKWSEWAFQLVDLRDDYPDIYAESVYAKEFEHFDGSTGYDLHDAYMQDNIVNKALYLLRMERKKQNV